MQEARIDFYRFRAYFILVFCIFLIRCNAPENQSSPIMVTDTSPTLNSKLDLQGHRGCRGIMPENTIPGFLKALDLGVHTLELDVVITSDRKVLCSHEPWFSHTIALDPDGKLNALPVFSGYLSYMHRWPLTRGYFKNWPGVLRSNITLSWVNISNYEFQNGTDYDNTWRVSANLM